jgi:pimeloyl-ACP methyl ester carboxylesterase
MPRDFPWTLDIIIDDYVCLMRSLGIARFHLVAAKLGGTVARRFAARFPDLVQTLTVVGTPPPRRDHVAARTPEWTKEFETQGVEAWARRTMAGRLGSTFPPEGVEWWAQLMGRTAASTQIGFIEKIAGADISADLPRIACPTLVISTEGSALGSRDETRAWQETIPNSRLLVLPGDSYHAAASDPERCARETRNFIRETAAAAA